MSLTTRYLKYIDEQDLLGRVFAKEKEEATAKGKTAADLVDPRFADRKNEKKKKPAPKKDKGKNAAEVVLIFHVVMCKEPEEVELEDTTLDKKGCFDYVYYLLDFGTEAHERELLKKYKNVLFLSCVTRGINPPVKKRGLQDDINLLNSQILDASQFEAEYRLKIEKFIDGEVKTGAEEVVSKDDEY